MDRAEGEWVPLSALQHYVYCPRQCALIHVEQVWEENLFTLRGRRAHELVHRPEAVVREGVRTERALPLWSDRLGLIGQADIVEFLPDGGPYPVEHKSGARRARQADAVQLCAQGLCLEEMLGRPVPRGALYYHASHRRQEVAFTPDLRQAVVHVTEEVRELLTRHRLPPPVADARCRDCSLVEACLPFVLRALAHEAEGGRPS